MGWREGAIPMNCEFRILAKKHLLLALLALLALLVLFSVGLSQAQITPLGDYTNSADPTTT
jgi:hypothetical protein